MTAVMWLLQADELKAKIEVLKSASLEASEQVQSLQEETGRLRAELASRAMELDLVQADAAQASQQAQRSAAHADSMQEAIGRLQAELTSKTEELLQASFIILNILIICMAQMRESTETCRMISCRVGRGAPNGKLLNRCVPLCRPLSMPSARQHMLLRSWRRHSWSSARAGRLSKEP